ncbi:MAG: protein kinase [Gemmatimonadota bacterium]
MSFINAPGSNLATALADRYRIERELGAGGMATVYLAQDLKHDRRVAVKVLRPELAAVIGAERFLAEIKTTANLQHPHILPLFDSGAADSFLFYVMPYVEGESLRDRLNREKQLPIADAVRIATEVASALDYAHRHGVIHRDIKPENVMLHDGQSLVADFGIALAASKAGGSRMTETGMSLGTPHYMSPEQAMGEREITARSDVYALGAMTYEMLAGDPPFTGSTAQAIVAKVMTDDPAPLRRHRKAVPEHVEAAVLTALEKLPADRWGSAREFAEALAGAVSTTSRIIRNTSVPGWQRHAGTIIGALTLVAITASVLAIHGRGRTGGTEVNRLNLALPDQGLTAPGGTRFAWAPDGRAFVYVGPGPGGSQLWLRSLDALEATAIQGTDGASSPFFSPDGSQIGFISPNPFDVRVVPRAGGNVTTLVSEELSGGGASWGTDGYIYFDGLTNLSRIRANGSGREVVAPLDTLQHEIGIAWPQALPGGRGVLYRLRHTGDEIDAYTVMVTDLRTHARKLLVKAVFARYLPTGHLLYVTADGSLMATRFNLDRLEMTGTPALLQRGIGIGGFGAVDLGVSSTGSLLYTTGQSSTITEPTWVTRDGKSTPVDPTWREGIIGAVAISPDGSRLATQLLPYSSGSATLTQDIWVKRLDAGPLSRLTFEGNANEVPSWSHDGREILFVSDRSGARALYRQRADGSGAAQLLATDPRGLRSGFESPDGRWLVLRSMEGTVGRGDILGLRIGVDTAPVPLVATPFRERDPALSPDGRWLAYASDETGQFEVYVRPFPDVQAGKWQVSTGGGTGPRWGHRGNELFYRDMAQDMIAVHVVGQPAFSIVGRQRLFSAASYFSTLDQVLYDVAPDDRRFLMLHVGSESGTGSNAGRLILVQNFLAELRKAVR